MLVVVAVGAVSGQLTAVEGAVVTAAVPVVIFRARDVGLIARR
jgi:hypothetical protein